MSDFVIALLFGIGSGGWIYSKMYHRTGGNQKPTLIVTAISFIVITAVFYSLIKILFHN